MRISDFESWLLIAVAVIIVSPALLSHLRPLWRTPERRPDSLTIGGFLAITSSVIDGLLPIPLANRNWRTRDNGR
jgi:hypothetical protein